MLKVNQQNYGGAGTGPFSARRQVLPSGEPVKRGLFRLPDGDAAYIKESLAVSDQATRFFGTAWAPVRNGPFLSHNQLPDRGAKRSMASVIAPVT
jgi:hypothetical protein